MTLQPNVLGWILIFVLLYWWSQSSTGHETIFVALVLILILLLLQNYQNIIADFFNYGG